MADKRQEVMRVAGKLAENMIKLSNCYEKNCSDDICLLVYGLIRDCGYRVKRVVSEACSEC